MKDKKPKPLWIRSSYSFSPHIDEKLRKRAALKHGGNKTAYLSNLIDKDK